MTPFKCPVCNGTALVSRPPHVAGDVEEWGSADTGPYPCRACVNGIVWGPAAPPAVVPSVFGPGCIHEYEYRTDGQFCRKCGEPAEVYRITFSEANKC